MRRVPARKRTASDTTTVILSPRQGRTLLRVVKEDSGLEDERLSGWSFSTFVGLLPAILAGAFVAVTLDLGDLIGVLTVDSVLIASLLVGGRWLSGRVRHRRRRQTEEVQALADHLTRQFGTTDETLTPGKSTGETVAKIMCRTAPSLEISGIEIFRGVRGADTIPV